MKINNHSQKIDGSGLKISIVLPYFNDRLGMEMLENCREELLKNKVREKNIKLIRVAGSLEIPYGCLKATELHKPHAIIALGVIIKGKTPHFEQIANTCHYGLMKLQLEKKIPIAMAILTCNNIREAKERVSKKHLDKGKEAAQAALIQTLIK